MRFSSENPNESEILPRKVSFNPETVLFEMRLENESYDDPGCQGLTR